MLHHPEADHQCAVVEWRHWPDVKLARIQRWAIGEQEVRNGVMVALPVSDLGLQLEDGIGDIISDGGVGDDGC